MKPRHVPADHFNAACYIESRNIVLWFGRPDSHAHGERLSPHAVVVTCVDGSRVNAYQHLIVSSHRLVDLSEYEDIR